MNNTKKETISTGKKVIFAITIVIAIVSAMGLIYGMVRANSQVIAQASMLAASDVGIILLNSRNVKKELEEKREKNN